MSEPTVDVRRNLHMAYQHIVICGPDETVQAALIAVEDAVAELIEADREYDEAQAALDRTGIQTECMWKRLYVAINRRAAALARVGSPT